MRTSLCRSSGGQSCSGGYRTFVQHTTVLDEEGVRGHILSSVQAYPPEVPPSRGHGWLALRLAAGPSHDLGDVLRSYETWMLSSPTPVP